MNFAVKQQNIGARMMAICGGLFTFQFFAYWGHWHQHYWPWVPLAFLATSAMVYFFKLPDKAVPKITVDSVKLLTPGRVCYWGSVVALEARSESRNPRRSRWLRIIWQGGETSELMLTDLVGKSIYYPLDSALDLEAAIAESWGKPIPYVGRLLRPGDIGGEARGVLQALVGLIALALLLWIAGGVRYLDTPPLDNVVLSAVALAFIPCVIYLRGASFGVMVFVSGLFAAGAATFACAALMAIMGWFAHGEPVSFSVKDDAAHWQQIWSSTDPARGMSFTVNGGPKYWIYGDGDRIVLPVYSGPFGLYAMPRTTYRGLIKPRSED